MDNIEDLRATILAAGDLGPDFLLKDSDLVMRIFGLLDVDKRIELVKAGLLLAIVNLRVFLLVLGLGSTFLCKLLFFCVAVISGCLM